MAKAEKKNKPKTKQLDRTERRNRVISLYKACGNVRTVAERLNQSGLKVSKSTVANDINAVFAELQSDTLAKAEHLRTLQYTRYSSIIAVFWLTALQGDMKASYLVLKTMDKINEIFGLKAPEEHRFESVNVALTLEDWRKNKETRRQQAAATLAMFEENE